MSYKANFIEQLGESAIIEIHNEYCERSNDMDSMIYPNDEEHFNMLVGESTSPWDVIDAVADDYDKNDDYLRYSIYGIESTSDITDWVDFEALERMDLSRFVDEDECIEYLENEEMMLRTDKEKEQFEDWLDEEGYDLCYDDDWENIEDEYNDYLEEQEEENEEDEEEETD